MGGWAVSGFRISIKGTAIEDVARVKKRLDGLGIPMNQLATFAERETKLNFERESSPDGAKWAPLAASTLKQKKGGAILRDTSALVGGISVLSVSKTSAVIGATAGSEYGIFHQRGTSKMSAREFIGVSDPIRQAAERIFSRWFSGL